MLRNIHCLLYSFWCLECWKWHFRASRFKNFLGGGGGMPPDPPKKTGPYGPLIVTAAYYSSTIRLLQILLKTLGFGKFLIRLLYTVFMLVTSVSLDYKIFKQTNTIVTPTLWCGHSPLKPKYVLRIAKQFIVPHIRLPTPMTEANAANIKHSLGFLLFL